jgi:hypothetical protein
VLLDIWNVSGPTIMVMEIATRVNDEPTDREALGLTSLTPQLLVESGKVASVNVAWQLMRRVSPGSEGLIDFPDLTTADAHFRVSYFSLSGERFVETRCRFQFRVTEDNIIAWIVDEKLPFPQNFRSSSTSALRPLLR